MKTATFITIIAGTAALLLQGCVCAPPATKVSAARFTGGPMFDGKTLTGWKATDFSNRGKVEVENGAIQLRNGYMTGVTWTNDLPRMNYEISLDAMRVEGSDFFCGLTFPVDTNYLSFIVGGWGGGTVGMSSIDSEDASSNETTKFMNFTTGRWYHIRVRVTPKKVQAWLDDEKVVDFEWEERRLSIRLEVESCTPLGVATWNTAGALKDIKLTTMTP